MAKLGIKLLEYGRRCDAVGCRSCTRHHTVAAIGTGCIRGGRCPSAAKTFAPQSQAVDLSTPDIAEVSSASMNGKCLNAEPEVSETGSFDSAGTPTPEGTEPSPATSLSL